jgi:uncharacterized protein (TIRG00374 family)
MRHRWKTLLGLALSAVLLWWALGDVSPGGVWSEIRGANLGLLVLAALLQTAGFLIRAARWGVILRPALERVRYYPRFAATCIGFMANNLLPARVGEFARALSFTRLAPVGLSAALGSLVVERFLDALVLALFVALPVLVPGFLAGGAGAALSDAVGAKLIAIVPIFAAALAGLALIVWRPHWMARIVEAVVGRLVSRRLGARLGGAVESFAHGLGLLKRPRLFAGALAWSFAHWLWCGFAFFLGMLAFDIRSPGYLGALFLQGVNGFLVAIPSAPGFFGPFEASVRLALGPFDVAAEKVVGYAVGFHLAGFFPVTFLGLYYVWRLGLTWSEVEHSEEIVEEGAPAA